MFELWGSPKDNKAPAGAVVSSKSHASAAAAGKVGKPDSKATPAATAAALRKPSKTEAAAKPPSAQDLALRKVKREEESKNLREFVKAQRNAMVSGGMKSVWMSGCQSGCQSRCMSF